MKKKVLKGKSKKEKEDEKKEAKEAKLNRRMSNAKDTRNTMGARKKAEPEPSAAPAYVTQPGGRTPAMSMDQAGQGHYVTSNPCLGGSSGGAPPMMVEQPRPVMSEYTVPSNIMAGAPPKEVNAEYKIPSGVPEQMPEERRWEIDWKMLGPTADGMAIRLEQLLHAFGNVPDAFKGIMFELTGEWVSRDRFFELIRAFGPYGDLVKNISAVFSQQWFFNFMSAEEANRWLSTEVPGTFLVRFAEPGSVGAFAVCYVTGGDGPTRVVQERVVPNFPDPTFTLESQQGPVVCNGLFHVLDTIHARQPLNIFQNRLVEEIWFHGGVTADDATELLRTRPSGTFLVRFSTQQFSYTISQIVDDQQFISVTHTRLLQTPEGWFRDPNTGKSWQSLDSFLQLASLNNPLVNRIPMIRKLGAQLASGGPPSDGPPSAGGAPDGASGPVFIE